MFCIHELRLACHRESPEGVPHTGSTFPILQWLPLCYRGQARRSKGRGKKCQTAGALEHRAPFGHLSITASQNNKY